MPYYKRAFNEFGAKLDAYNKAHSDVVIRFEEYFCKNILERVACLPKITVKDKPDLRCEIDGKSVGIEATSSASEDYMKLLYLVDYTDGKLYVPHGLSVGQQQIVDKFFPLVHDGSGIRNVNFRELDFRMSAGLAAAEIKTTFDKKCEKANSYACMDEFRLFIFCRYNVSFSLNLIDDMVAYFSSMDVYSTVYVFDCFYLHVFSNGRHSCFPCFDEVEAIKQDTICEILDMIDGV